MTAYKIRTLLTGLLFTAFVWLGSVSLKAAEEKIDWPRAKQLRQKSKKGEKLTPEEQAYLDKAEELGGKTVMPPTEIPDIVTLAMFSDPEGNLIGMIKG